MLLSRFWYVVLALVLGGAIFLLYLATGMYNRSGARSMGEALYADSQVVGWYLKDDARTRSSHLIKFALDSNVGKILAASSKSERPPTSKVREQLQRSLKRVNETIPKEQAFDAVFAIDRHGRVVAHLGYEQASGLDDFELGGYPVVADALHGYIRDDTLVLDRLYRVVARPVEVNLGSAPDGAIVGARILDDRFATELSQRTGAAVAFYVGGQRVSSGAPEGFDRSQLDQIISDLEDLKEDEDYQQKGRSQVRVVGKSLGVQYSRLQGEAWMLGAGYVVARLPSGVETPLGFLDAADDTDKGKVDLPLVIVIVILGAGLGLAFTVLEHTRPLRVFRGESAKLAKGEIDQLQPSRFRGIYRKIASDLNDGVDHIAAKGGVVRRAADLKEVLGDIPEEPQMSAFSFPGEQAAASGPTPAVAPSGSSPGASKALPKPPRRGGPPSPPGPGGPPADAAGDPEEAEWQGVFQEFVSTKQQCGENLDGFTYEKFRQTLVKNRDALINRHGASRVKFSVYVKDGKAALKASPLKS